MLLEHPESGPIELNFLLASPLSECFFVGSQRKSIFQIGGSVIVRDYGINDYAMISFGRGAKLADRFYVRQDGTRAFYFKTEELTSLFETAGFETERCEYLHRQTYHQRTVNVPRIFVQARFKRIK